MAFASQRTGAPITGINVTPLVDITLVLLIIFMVTARLVVSRAMPLDLPQAATGGQAQTLFSVSIGPGGDTWVDGERLASDQDLLLRARAALLGQPELRAVLQADGAVPHRQVLHALDLLRLAGVGRVAFGVPPGPPVATEPAQ